MVDRQIKVLNAGDPKLVENLAPGPIGHSRPCIKCFKISETMLCIFGKEIVNQVFLFRQTIHFSVNYARCGTVQIVLVRKHFTPDPNFCRFIWEIVKNISKRITERRIIFVMISVYIIGYIKL